MDLTTDIDEHTAVLTVTGDLDAPVAYRPYEEMVSVLDGDTVERVILDVAGVGFADSVALGMLVRMKQHADDNDARFEVRGAPPQLRRLLEITALTGELPLT